MSHVHTIRAGESLSGLAARYGVAPAAILNANPRKPRARALGGAEVFASLSFGEPVIIPVNTMAPPSCIDPNAHIDRFGACVCDAGHFVAPTGHCMRPVAFLPPMPHAFVPLNGLTGDDEDLFSTAPLELGLRRIRSRAFVPLGDAGDSPVAAAMKNATSPVCPAGTTIDPTGEYCLDPNAMPPGPPCPSGLELDDITGTGKYCFAPGKNPRASFGCPMTPQPGGGSIGSAYMADFKVCMPSDFTGGDTAPDGSICPGDFPFYDSASGTCMRPRPSSPGTQPPALSSWTTIPTCISSSPGPTMEWNATTKACVAKAAPPAPSADSTPSAAPLLTPLQWGIAAVAGVLLGGGLYMAATAPARQANPAKRLTKEQKKALDAYNFKLREEDRYLGSVFVTRKGQERVEAETKQAYDRCKALGMGPEHGL